MPDPLDFTAKAMLDKVLGYGDRVVDKGVAATTPPSGMTSVAPAPVPAPQPLTVTIYDPQKALQGSVAAAVKARLETDLNALTLPGQKGDYLLKKVGVRFEVRFVDRMSTQAERTAAGVFDFPIHLLAVKGNFRVTATAIHDLMVDYGIRDSNRGHEQYVQADQGWTGSAEGLGIQPLVGYRKVGFVKADELSSAAKDLVIGFSNVLKHELGHMMNVMDHTTGGAMRSPATYTAHLDYAAKAQTTMVSTLTLFATTPQADLDRRYVQQNP
jgi:hypothetical protein